jgi:hypothetical protein
MSDRRTIPLPLSTEDDCWATLTAAWPISEDAWARMLHILDTMKPALVTSAARPESGERDGDA